MKNGSRTTIMYEKFRARWNSANNGEIRIDAKKSAVKKCCVRACVRVCVYIS